MRNEFQKQVKKDVKREERKKGMWVRIAVFSFVAVIVWSAALAVLFTRLFEVLENKPTIEIIEPSDEVIHFANVDWEEDIYQNDRWLERDRQIYFGTQYSHQAITEESAEKLGDYAVFFYDYFQYIISGDATGYRSCFADSYPFHTLPNKFTKQKLFEIYALEYKTESGLDENGDTLVFTDFIVEYKILENNGTFRDDLKSSAAREQYYRLITDENGEIKIYSIYEIQSAELETPSESETSPSDMRAFWIIAAIIVLLLIPLIFLVWLISRRKRKEK